MKKFGRELKKIETINGGEKIEYEKDLPNDDSRLNKPTKLRLLTIIIRSVFSENGKIHSQLFLDDARYEL